MKKKQKLYYLILNNMKKELYKELVELILRWDESEEQKQYWIDLIPSFTPIHIERLKGIYRRQEETMKKLEVKFKDCKNDMSKEEVYNLIK